MSTAGRLQPCIAMDAEGMSQWRVMALSMVPGLRREIELAQDRTMLWDALRENFCATAHDRGSSACCEIIAYYRWSVSDQREALPNEVQTSAVLGFLEYMVRDPKRLRLLPPWLSRSEVLDYSRNITYAMGPAGVDEVRAAFDAYERTRSSRP